MFTSTIARTRRFCRITGLLIALAGAPASAVAADAVMADTLLTAPIPAVDGPKRTVAVAPFGATSHFVAEFGLTDVGGGLAAMLTGALMESGQFLVVERSQLSTVLAEQELGANALAKPESAVLPGGLLGAQLLIFGEVTEFSDADKGRGIGLGFSLGRKQLGLSPQSRSGTVAIDVRVVDTASGQVVAAFGVRETIKARSLAVNIGYEGHSAGMTDFLRTPIGQAARSAINQAVQQFAAAAASQPWSGSVVDVEAQSLVINAGTNSGIKVGDRFEIRRVSKVLTDPTTGRVLARRTETMGHATVEQVGDTLAYARYSMATDMAPTRGDLVLGGT